MPLVPHPLAGPRVAAAGSRVRTAGLLEILLRALLAALLGRPRGLVPLATAATSHCALLADADELWTEHTAYAYAAPLRGWHADCESPILYVIGPPPNRGMRRRPRATPLPCPRIARAPPRPLAPPMPA